MGVNWQNNDYYRGLKDYEKQTGLSLAEQNAINNPYGSHSFGGLLISQLPQLIAGGAEKIGSGTGLNGTIKEEEGIDVAKNTSLISQFTKAKQGYDIAKKSGNSQEMKKYAIEIKRIGDENNNGTKDATIINIYNNQFQTEIQKIVNGK